MKRYQDCNLIIKIYRWLRWKPYFAIKALIKMLGKVESKSLVWKIHMGLADVKMKHLYTLQETRERIKKRVG